MRLKLKFKSLSLMQLNNEILLNDFQSNLRKNVLYQNENITARRKYNSFNRGPYVYFYICISLKCLYVFCM